MKWPIAEPIESVYLTAEVDGIYLRNNTEDSLSEILSKNKQLSLLGQSLPSLVPQLLERGYAESNDHHIKIPYEKFIKLSNDDIYAFEDLVPYVPFFIELSTTGILGRDDFKYQIKYFLGLNQIATPERRGCFIKRLGMTYRLDNQTYSLINEIHKFRKLTPKEKSSSESIIRFATIRGLAEGVGAQIDQFIKSNKILIPPALGIDLIEEEDGRVSFAPFVDGVSREDLRRVFLQAEDVTDLMIDDGKGGRVRLVFNYEQQEALKRMTKVRHLGGKDKVRILGNPQGIFDGVADAVDLEVGDFGPRVKGIGKFPFISQPVIQRSNTGIFDDDYPLVNGEKGGSLKSNAGINCRYADGTEETVYFSSKDELIHFNDKVQRAYQNGDGFVEVGERSIVLDHDFAQGVSALVKRLITKKSSIDDDSKKYLLIFENYDQLDYEEKYCPELMHISLPHQMKDDFQLKPHQEEGIRWLQYNYSLEGKKGCLLADDMGLGKTLQVLVFVAWLIEQGKLTPEGSNNPEGAPWKPVLIITPVMLLENDTWIQDMKKFFKNDGAIFTPWCVLHGQKLKDMRTPGVIGQEISAQRPLLDLERLRQYRIILTNYETIVNYQYSFASMKSDWTLVVTDEAQAQKTPKTKISHALKSLSPKFRIACTGTPVETRLLDVWNIMDYLQPGELLGSASSFTKAYEQPLNDNPNQILEILGSLRDRLHYGKPTSFILRREKTQALKGLPKKYEYKVMCELSTQQRERHLEYINRAREGGEGNHPFALIQGLMKLYQHPSLIHGCPTYEFGNIKTFIDACPKLQKLLDILGDIKRKGEKALIFTRNIDVQQILADSILQTFRQHIDIVNGAANRHETATSSMTRKAMIARFRSDPRLNFIILSPEVAGIGLTLVEANHVIHYGRWWNPAKESQATDRAYRIGQERDVSVYYLIAKDPLGQFVSFDEKLDALIDRRRKMARDFLAPMPGEQDLQEELYKDIFKDPAHEQKNKKPIEPDAIKLLPWDRFESLIAVLEQKNGNRVILTPKTGDMGIDVISVSGNQINLIQCKHRRYEDEVGQEIVAEVLNAFDTYRARFFAGTNYILKPVLVTNGRIPSTIHQNCEQHDIEVVAGAKLYQRLMTYPCTYAEIEFMEMSRIESINNIRERAMI